MSVLMRETHPLTLKVMRLSRPSLSVTTKIPLDSSTDSVIAQSLRDLVQNRPTDSGSVLSDMHIATEQHPLEGFPVTETLVLPKSAGTMYLGETFSAHMCICNDSTFIVRDVSIRVMMQTATQQLQLYDSGDKQSKGTAVNEDVLRQMGPGHPFNLQVAHEIKELGAHILACSIMYLSAQGERKTMQKSFKFQVSNPLVVKTKVNHLDRDVLLEVQVHNATNSTMALERLRFEAASPFEFEDLNLLQGGSSIWGSAAGFMQPGDVRQYLYRLRPKAEIREQQLTLEQERAIQYATALGKLDIMWRGSFGSVGRLQTSQLLRKSPGMFLIDIEKSWVVGSDSEKGARARVEEPFCVRMRLRNVSEQEMAVSAMVNTRRYPAAIPCGPAQYTLGGLAVGESKELDLTFLPLAPGVQRIGSVRLVDSLSGYTRDVDHLVDVFVAN
ncbi:hypothetical protein GGI12_000140 [Dipsacomyces acuminosporus]|nr:hypothetical protein GGI12_000140 [Dipsacomyces acuminosporus]